jgi:TonB family protein
VVSAFALTALATISLAGSQTTRPIECVASTARESSPTTPKLNLAECEYRQGRVIEAAVAVAEAMADIRSAADRSQGKSTLRTTTVHVPLRALGLGDAGNGARVGLVQIVADARGAVRTATVVKSLGSDERMLREIRRRTYAAPIGGRPLLVVVRAGGGNTPVDHIDLARFFYEAGDYLLAEWALGPAAYEITADARRLALAGLVVPEGEFGAGAYVPAMEEGGVLEPELLREVSPRYTAAARRERIEGTVLMQAIVGTDGRVGEARVIRSVDTHQGLDAEALATIRQWRFRPRQGPSGAAVSVFVTLSVAFKL